MRLRKAKEQLPVKELQKNCKLKKNIRVLKDWEMFEFLLTSMERPFDTQGIQKRIPKRPYL